MTQTQTLDRSRRQYDIHESSNTNKLGFDTQNWSLNMSDFLSRCLTEALTALNLKSGEGLRHGAILVASLVSPTSANWMIDAQIRRTKSDAETARLVQLRKITKTVNDAYVKASRKLEGIFTPKATPEQIGEGLKNDPLVIPLDPEIVRVVDGMEGTFAELAAAGNETEGKEAKGTK